MSYGRAFLAAVERARGATGADVPAAARQGEIIDLAIQGLTVPQMRALYVAHYSGQPLPRGRSRADVAAALRTAALADLNETTGEQDMSTEPQVVRRDLPTGSGEGWLVRYLGHSYAISQGHDGAVQAFRWNARAGAITDWDDLAGGHGTHEQALAALAARPVDEGGRVLSPGDVLDAAEAAEDSCCEECQP